MGNAQAIDRPKGGNVHEIGLNIDEIGPASINLDKERKESFEEGKEISIVPPTGEAKRTVITEKTKINTISCFRPKTASLHGLHHRGERVW